MARGRVTSFDYSKGSGLIAPENGGADVTVHFSQVKSKSQRTLHEGQRVEFEISREAGELRAKNVEILDGAAAANQTPRPARAPQTAAHASNAPMGNAPMGNARRKTKLWPLGVVGAGAILAVLVSSKSRVQPPQNLAPPTVAPAPVRAQVAAPKALTASKPAAKAATVPRALEGERFSQTHLRRMSAGEAGALSPDQLQYAISEMYARHGFDFRKVSKRKLFGQHAWYQPVKGQSEAASFEQFSAVEKSNLRLLAGLRTARQEQARTERAFQVEQRRIAQQNQRQEAEQQRIAQAAQAAHDERQTPDFTPSNDGFDTPRQETQTPPDVATPPDFASGSSDFTPTGKPIFTGPRGGRFHFSASGKKVYERRR